MCRPDYGYPRADWLSSASDQTILSGIRSVIASDGREVAETLAIVQSKLLLQQSSLIGTAKILSNLTRTEFPGMEKFAHIATDGERLDQLRPFLAQRLRGMSR
jgi:hypothetical protein